MPDKTTSIVLISIISFLSVFIYAPLLLWYLYYYNRERRTVHIAKRHPNLAIFFALIIVTLLIFWVPVRAFSVHFEYLGFSQSTQDSLEDALLAYVAFVYALLSQIGLGSLILRFWHAYYDFSDAVEGLDLKWIRYINREKSGEDWFVTHR